MFEEINYLSKRENKKIYIIDHYFAKNHLEYCRVIESNINIKEMKEMFITLIFYYEEKMNGIATGTQASIDSIIDVLSTNYQISLVNKDKIYNELKQVITEASLNDYKTDVYSPKNKNIQYIYFDLYEIRDQYCGKDMSIKLFKKWLTDEIIKDVKKILVEEK